MSNWHNAFNVPNSPTPPKKQNRNIGRQKTQDLFTSLKKKYGKLLTDDAIRRITKTSNSDYTAHHVAFQEANRVYAERMVLMMKELWGQVNKIYQMVPNSPPCPTLDQCPSNLTNEIKREAWRAVGGAVGGTVGKVGGAVGGTVGKVGGAVGGTVGKVGGAVGGTVGKVGGAVGGAVFSKFKHHRNKNANALQKNKNDRAARAQARSK